MKKNILLTGQPKSGKSTLLKKIIVDMPNRVGFVTNEIIEGVGRVGFEVETNKLDKAVIAHINLDTPNKVSRYSVDLSSLERIIPEVSNFETDQLLYVDEIGQMQLFSNKFRTLALSYLNSSNVCIATISSVFNDDFIKEVKGRDDVVLIELTADNRQEKEVLIRDLISKLMLENSSNIVH